MPSRICVAPLGSTLETFLSLSSCSDGTHHHISRSQLREHEIKDIVHYLRRRTSKRETDVVQIQILETRDDRWAGRPRRSRAASPAMNHGLSYRVGPYLAMCIRQHEKWAIVMLSHINNRPEREHWNDQENSK